MAAANQAALRAPGTPMAMVATGIPGGICTMASSASWPLRSPAGSGTPMTGSVVWAATTPGSAAAMPAMQMKVRTPRSSALVT